MHHDTSEVVYYLAYNAEGLTRRPQRKSVRFRYRIWLGKNLEPVCLITLDDARHASVASRLAIHRALLTKIPKAFRVRYFECVIASRRIITEVYFPLDGTGLCVPRGEDRSLAYLEGILGQQVSVV